MAGTTDNYQLPYAAGADTPSVNRDQKALAEKVDSVVKTVEDTALANALAVMPIGAVIQYAGTGAMLIGSNWLLCQGQEFPRVTDGVTHPLFAILGDVYGGLEPTDLQSGTFRLPDLRGRIPVGAAPGRLMSDDVDKNAPAQSRSNMTTVDMRGGEEKVQLTEAELAYHDHPIPHTHGGSTNTTGEHHHKVRDGSGSEVQTNWSLAWERNDNTYNNSTTKSGNHDHTISTGLPSEGNSSSAGEDSSHQNMPPYMVINYAIKAA